MFIPGVFYPETVHHDQQPALDKPHAFVLCFRNPDCIQCLYYAYPLSEFSFENHNDRFGYTIKIGKSTFTESCVDVDLDAAYLIHSQESDEAQFYTKAINERLALHGAKIPTKFNHYEQKHLSVKGKIEMINQTRIPTSTLNPGVMGPFAFLPFLECYHGIVSMYHDANGKVDFTNSDGTLESSISLDQGTGYIEKDHGIRFPKSWIWLQTHSFHQNPKSRGSSLLFSAADVPTLSDSVSKIPKVGEFLVAKTMMTGFLLVFYHAESKKTYNLSLFTGATINRIDFKYVTEADDRLFQLADIKVSLRNVSIQLNVRRELGQGIPLRAPTSKEMHLAIEESLNVEVHVQLFVDGALAFDDVGKEAGLEVVGDIIKIKKRINKAL